MTEQSCKDFEAWISKGCGDLSKFGNGNHIHYQNSAVNNAWTGWQAATKAERERCARVCELIKETALTTQTGPADDLSNVMLRQIAHMGAGACADLIRQGGDV